MRRKMKSEESELILQHFKDMDYNTMNTAIININDIKIFFWVFYGPVRGPVE